MKILRFEAKTNFDRQTDRKTHIPDITLYYGELVDKHSIKVWKTMIFSQLLNSFNCERLVAFEQLLCY